MTREQVIQCYLMNSPKVVAEMLYDTIERYKNRSCEGCKYSYYDKEDAIVICTNEDNNQEYLYNSKMQITLDFYCNKWESKC